jgi:hypothetical protein
MYTPVAVMLTNSTNILKKLTRLHRAQNAVSLPLGPYTGNGLTLLTTVIGLHDLCETLHHH